MDVTKQEDHHSVAPFATPFFLSARFHLDRLRSTQNVSLRAQRSPRCIHAKLPPATVLHFIVRQPRLSCLFAHIQRHPFPVRQMPQPGQVPAPRAGFEKLLFESLGFLTA
jgi:hypothetical protein